MIVDQSTSIILQAVNPKLGEEDPSKTCSPQAVAGLGFWLPPLFAETFSLCVHCMFALPLPIISPSLKAKINLKGPFVQREITSRNSGSCCL